jgi:hypothetical protein
VALAVGRIFNGQDRFPRYQHCRIRRWLPGRAHPPTR